MELLRAEFLELLDRRFGTAFAKLPDEAPALEKESQPEEENEAVDQGGEGVEASVKNLCIYRQSEERHAGKCRHSGAKAELQLNAHGDAAIFSIAIHCVN